MNTWKCTICGFVDGGEAAPAHCPECGAVESMFVASNESPHGIEHNRFQAHDERDQTELDISPGHCTDNG